MAVAKRTGFLLPNDLEWVDGRGSRNSLSLKRESSEARVGTLMAGVDWEGAGRGWGGGGVLLL